MEKKKEAILLIQEKLAEASSDELHMQNVQSFLDLLKMLFTIESFDGTRRTIVLQPAVLKSILSWPGDTTDEKIHPLMKLKSLETNDKIAETLEVVLLYLNTTDPIELQELTEPPLTQSEGIVQQFNMRPIFTLVDVYDERLHSNYWCNPTSDITAADVAAIDGDRVTCDLTDIIKTCLPIEISVTSECKRILHLSASPQSNRERTTTAPCFRTRRVEVEPTTGRPEKKIYSNLN